MNPNSAPKTELDNIREVMLREADAIVSTAARLGSSATEALELMSLTKQGRIVFSGMGKMGYIGRKAAATFCSTGSPAIFLHPAEAVHGDLGVIGNDDVFVALSGSGQTSEVLNLVPYLRRFDIPIIAITGNSTSDLAKRSRIVIDIGIDRETDGDEVAPTSSTTVALAVCDALAIAIARKRGFTRQQFAAFHPGGHLGRKLLLTVEELMHAGDAIPVATRETKLREAIVEMSRKRLGSVVVNDRGRIIGILTDGDVRRVFEKNENPLDESVERHMTQTPETIVQDALAADALRLMQERSITILPVVDSNQKLCGIIHLHDLLQAGIA